MKCEYCDNEVPPGSTRCPSCGATVKVEAAQPAAPAAAAAPSVIVVPAAAMGAQPLHPPKSRTAYVILGIFLGGLGIHNFYAGFTGRAIVQLLLSILSCGYLSLVSWLWAIVEVCTVKYDSSGVQFA